MDQYTQQRRTEVQDIDQQEHNESRLECEGHSPGWIGLRVCSRLVRILPGIRGLQPRAGPAV